MPITTMLCAALALGTTAQSGFSMRELTSFGVKEKRIAIQVSDGKLEQPHVAPKNDWEFEWIVTGYGRKLGGEVAYALRARIFSEQDPDDGKPAAIAQMVMRLWDFNYQKLSLDHSPVYNNQIVDFYLCTGGKPGGEQLFSVQKVGNSQVKVNTVYIYDMPSFNVPIEMAREVAHEYGHATLPPVGHFGKPEDWANGFLGEKLYLRWLRDQMAAKTLKPEDAMGVPFTALDAWVKRNVDPLVRAAALEGPDKRWLSSKGQKAMDSYLGLVLYADTILPTRVFARTTKLTGSANAVDYPAAVVAAVEEAEPFALSIPPYLAGKAVWLPLGKSAVTGAKELSRVNGWVKVQPTANKLSVKPPQPSP
jgi:hypothetical protein